MPSLFRNYVPYSASRILTGKWAIPPIFDVTGDFNEGLAPVIPDWERGKWGFINRTGELVIRDVFDKICEFSDSLACVQVGGEWGYIDKTGKWVIPQVYDVAGPFSEGLAPVMVDDSWGFIDTTGEWVIKPTNQRAYGFSEGVCSVRFPYRNK